MHRSTHQDATLPKNSFLQRAMIPVCIAAICAIAALAGLFDGGRSAAIAAASAILMALLLLVFTRLLQAELIAEREAAHSALTASKQYFERVLNAIPVTIFMKDANSHYTFVNDAFCELRAMSREEILAAPLSKMRDEHGRATESEAEDKLVFGGKPVFKEERVFHPDTGQEIFRTVSKRICHDDKGQALIVGSTQNISVWRQAERDANAQSDKHLRQRHFLKFILNTIPIPVYVKDEELYYILVNQAFADLLGLPEEEIIGKRANEFALSDTVLTDEMHEMAMLAKPSLQPQAEHCLITDSHGKPLSLISRKVAGRNADGNQVIVGTYANKTLRKTPSSAAEDDQTKHANDKPEIPYLPPLNGNHSMPPSL